MIDKSKDDNWLETQSCFFKNNALNLQKITIR